MKIHHLDLLIVSRFFQPMLNSKCLKMKPPFLCINIKIALKDPL